jgi:hypothetical protein
MSLVMAIATGIGLLILTYLALNNAKGVADIFGAISGQGAKSSTNPGLTGIITVLQGN